MAVSCEDDALGMRCDRDCTARHCWKVSCSGRGNKGRHIEAIGQGGATRFWRQKGCCTVTCNSDSRQRYVWRQQENGWSRACQESEDIDSTRPCPRARGTDEGWSNGCSRKWANWCASSRLLLVCWCLVDAEWRKLRSRCSSLQITAAKSCCMHPISLSVNFAVNFKHGYR